MELSVSNAFAEKLLAVKAIKLQPNDPFTWASGWKSPQVRFTSVIKPF